MSFSLAQVRFVFLNFSFVCQNISKCLNSTDHPWPMSTVILF